MSELRKILNKFGDEWLGSPKSYLTLIKKTIGKINRWHIRERKKWAMVVLGEKRKIGPFDYLHKKKYVAGFDAGYNQCWYDIRKRMGIEEG